MNQADFCVVPSARPSSCELMPFLELAMSQTAGSHLSSPSAESSKIVPTLTENCRLHALHFQMRRVVRYECSLPSQRGQIGPSGQRILATNSVATSRSLKYRTASRRFVGKAFSLAMPVSLLRHSGCVKY